MARPKKPTYEYVPSRDEYRKRIKDADGKYVAIYAKTSDELETKVIKAQDDITECKFRKDTPTVREYAEKWLQLFAVDLKPKNKEQHYNAVRLHIDPIIGDKYIADVKPDDAQLVMTALAGKSASLQGKVLSVMRRIFDNAVNNDLIRRNPCDKLKNNGYRAKEKSALSPAQIQVLLEAVKGTRAETFVLLGLYTGMRKEEILALKWDCVHLPKDQTHYITVKRALRWEHNRPEISDILKSAAGRRDIPIPACLSEYLSKLSPQSGFVVGGKDALTQTQYKNLWAIVDRRKVGERTYRASRTEKVTKVTFDRVKGAKSRGGAFRYTIDFTVTPHILRHTYITNLILTGADPKTVQYLAGHADSHLTLDIYTHLVDKNPDKLAAHVYRAFGVQFEVHSGVESQKSAFP